MTSMQKEMKEKAQESSRASRIDSGSIPKDDKNIANKREDFNHFLLPGSVAPHVENVAMRMNSAPISFAGIAVLAVLSISIGARVGVRPKINDNWTVIPNLWGAMIAPPSIKKSPIYEEMIKPLKSAEVEERTIFEEAQREYSIAKGEFDIEMKTYKKRKERGDNEVSRPLLSEKQPTQTRYIINDATTEKVGEIMKDNPKGVLVAVDELSGFFATQNKTGREGDRAFWLSTWNGNSSHTIDRIQRGTFYIPNVCASILGTIQPDSLLKIVEESMKVGAGDGMVQRFQLIAIENESNYEYTDMTPNYKAQRAYSELVHRILKEDPLLYGAEADEYDDDLLFYRLSHEANALFKKWSKELNNKIQSEQEHNPALASHLGKFESFFASLALILFYSDRVMGVIQEDTISLEYAQRAKDLCDFFEYQSTKLYDLGAIKESRDNTKLEKLLKKLKELNSNNELPITYGKLSQKVREVNANDCRTLLKGYIKEEDKRIVRLL